MTGVRLLMAVLVPIILAQAAPPPICDGTELPCDPARPWVRGSVEKSCGTETQIDKLREDHPGVTFVPCACHHSCDPLDPYAGDTDRRKWDGRCAARCNPRNCACPHPCDS